MKTKEVLCIWIVSLITLLNINAQTTVKGKVLDSLGKGIPYVNILVTSKLNAKAITYTYSNENGAFTLRMGLPGSYTLEFSALGYKTKKGVINIVKPRSNTKTLSITLKNENFELDEVIVYAEKPIIFKKDTLTFRVKSFLKGNEQVVEDLLKNIPGLQIDDDGMIKVGNKEIEKLMIEGDDFFKKGYRILSKNMPSFPIEKIQVLHNYSNNKLLKGIEKSNKVALNLVLNKEARNIWFGNLNLASEVSSSKRYFLKANIMNFGKKSKYYFLSNLNTVGYDPTGDLWQLIYPYSTENTSIIGNNQMNTPILKISSKVPRFKESRTKFNNSKLHSVNAIFNPNNKLKIKTIGFYNGDKTNFYKHSLRQFKLNDSSFSVEDEVLMDQKNDFKFAKINLQYDVSSNEALEGEFKQSNQIENSNLHVKLTPTGFEESLYTDYAIVETKIAYTHKLNSKRVFLITGRYFHENNQQEYVTNQSNALFDERKSNTSLQQINNEVSFVGFEGKLMQKNKKNLVEYSIGNAYRKDELNSSFQLRQGKEVLNAPKGFQNNIQYVSNNFFIKASHHKKLHDLTLVGEITYHWMYAKLFNTDWIIEQRSFMNPNIGFDWKINRSNKLNFRYAVNASNTKAIDVYPNYLMTDYRSFFKGVKEFRPLKTETYSLNYQMGNWGSKFFANALMFYTKEHDFYGVNSLVTNKYTLLEQSINQFRETTSITANVDRFLNSISSNIKMSFNYFTSSYSSKTNGVFQPIFTENYALKVELRSGFKGVFNYHLGNQWSLNKLSSSFSSTFRNSNTFLDLTFMFSDSFYLNAEFEKYHFGSVTQLGAFYYFADFEARYVLKKNKMSIILTGTNIFNTDRFVESVIGDVSHSATTYKLLPRFVILKFKYRF